MTVQAVKGDARPLRLGLSGLSHDHISIVANLSPGDFEIVGIFDKSAELTSAVGATLGAGEERRFASLAKMIETARPDAVAAFGSIREHLEVVEACAPAGVHVMVEKPLAIDLESALRIGALAARHRVHVLTNYETTWYPSIERVFRDVRSGVIGAPRKMLVRCGHGGPMESGCQPQFLAWLVDPAESGGGALNDFGCYGANLATCLTEGRLPNAVTAITRAFKPEHYRHVEDDALVVLDYGDLEVVIQASWNWPFPRKDIEVYGTHGMLAAPDPHTVQLRETSRPATEQITPDPLPPRNAEPFAYLAAVLRGEAMPPYALSAIGNNIAVVRILDAARRSAATGRTVALGS